MTDMDKIQKDNAEPGKAPDKMSADKLHLFATQYAFIDGRLHEAEQAMLKFMLEFLAQYGRVSLGLTEEEELDDNNFPVTTTLYGTDSISTANNTPISSSSSATLRR